MNLGVSQPSGLLLIRSKFYGLFSSAGNYFGKFAFLSFRRSGDDCDYCELLLGLLSPKLSKIASAGSPLCAGLYSDDLYLPDVLSSTWLLKSWSTF